MRECVRAYVYVRGVCACALRIVSTETILRFINTLIIIIIMNIASRPCDNVLTRPSLTWFVFPSCPLQWRSRCRRQQPDSVCGAFSVDNRLLICLPLLHFGLPLTCCRYKHAQGVPGASGYSSFVVRVISPLVILRSHLCRSQSVKRTFTPL